MRRVRYFFLAGCRFLEPPAAQLGLPPSPSPATHRTVGRGHLPADEVKVNVPLAEARGRGRERRGAGRAGRPAGLPEAAQEVHLSWSTDTNKSPSQRANKPTDTSLRHLLRTREENPQKHEMEKETGEAREGP